MPNLGKAFTYLIAAQVQAVTFILMAYWVGEWLNKNHPMSFNWYVVTFTVGVLGVAQTFYVVIRAALVEGKTPEGEKKSEKSEN